MRAQTRAQKKIAFVLFGKRKKEEEEKIATCALRTYYLV